jgi:hypothetical protein
MHNSFHRLSLARVIVVIFAIVTPLFSALAQIPEYEAFVCPDVTYSEYMPDDRQSKSHWICDSDNDYWLTYTGDTNIVSSIAVQRVGDGDDHYKARLKINWVQGAEGTIFVEVSYKRYWVKCGVCTGCEVRDERVIYKYRIDRMSTNPGGTLIQANCWQRLKTCTNSV